MIGVALLCSSCCEDLERKWEVSGNVVNSETGEAFAGARLEVTMVFSIEGVGNQVIEGVTTAADGSYLAATAFTASCRPVLFGFFGSEVSNTAGPPRWVDLIVQSDGREARFEFSIRTNPAFVTEFEGLSDGSVRGRIDLPLIEFEPAP